MSRTTIAGQLNAPEGPLVGPGPWLLSVCSLTREPDWPTRGGDITATRHDRPGDTTVIFSTSTADVHGIPAALAFGPDGALYVTDEGHRAVLRVPPDGPPEPFITHWNGEPINGPNDLSFDSDGNLFFTDPWTSSPRNPVGAVYGYTWATGELHRIDDGMQFPNGIVVREDRLYVAETFPRLIWVYDVVGPGRAEGKRVFCELPDAPDAPPLPADTAELLGVDRAVGPDGMAADVDGNLYVAHYGSGQVFVYDPDGVEIGRIDAGGVNPTNVCFGGPDHATLFITVDDTGRLVAVESGTTGERLNFCPSAIADHPWAVRLTADRPLGGAS